MLTAEQLVVFPDDGIDRWLIRGELRSRPWEHRTPGTSLAMTGVGCALSNWAELEKPDRGVVLIDAYHRLARDPDTTVGIDVSLIRKQQWAAARGKPFVEGCPLLAVKVASPSDTHGDVTNAIHLYLDSGVPIVWVLNPYFDIVTWYRPDAEPVSFNRQQELTAEPHLPGFRVRVAELFA
jgi:Uma2 family endonuclease